MLVKRNEKLSKWLTFWWWVFPAACLVSCLLLISGTLSDIDALCYAAMVLGGLSFVLQCTATLLLLLFGHWLQGACSLVGIIVTAVAGFLSFYLLVTHQRHTAGIDPDTLNLSGVVVCEPEEWINELDEWDHEPMTVPDDSAAYQDEQ